VKFKKKYFGPRNFVKFYNANIPTHWILQIQLRSEKLHWGNVNEASDYDDRRGDDSECHLAEIPIDTADNGAKTHLIWLISLLVLWPIYNLFCLSLTTHLQQIRFAHFCAYVCKNPNNKEPGCWLFVLPLPWVSG